MPHPGTPGRASEVRRGFGRQLPRGRNAATLRGMRYGTDSTRMAGICSMLRVNSFDSTHDSLSNGHGFPAGAEMEFRVTHSFKRIWIYFGSSIERQILRASYMPFDVNETMAIDSTFPCSNWTMTFRASYYGPWIQPQRFFHGNGFPIGFPDVLLRLLAFRSHHLHSWIPWNAEVSHSSEILLLFFVGQPDVCWAVASRCATKNATAFRSDRGMKMGIVEFQSLRMSTLFATR